MPRGRVAGAEALRSPGGTGRNITLNKEPGMDWRSRSMRRPSLIEPGHAHELTFSCIRGFPFLKAERTCQWLADAVDEARKDMAFTQSGAARAGEPGRGLEMVERGLVRREELADAGSD